MRNKSDNIKLGLKSEIVKTGHYKNNEDLGKPKKRQIENILF